MMEKKIIVGICFIFAVLILSGCAQPADQNSQANNSNVNTNANNGVGDLANTVQNGDDIKVEYKGTLESGELFDQSAGRGPLEFTVGAGQMINGFDSAVVGMKLNEEKTVTLPPEQAYGAERADLIVTVPQEQFGADANKIAEGMYITISSGAQGKITSIKDGNVTVNFNHELAGKTLIFWIKVVEINKAK
jgi:FKBP-type peptidyl-prolyl cis-trans isomerase 2